MKNVKAVLFDAVGTLIRPYPSVGAVYARAAAENGLRCPAGALNLHFRKVYHRLTAERFYGGGDFRTSEARERRWWKKVVTGSFERARCGSPPAAAVEAAFEAFARGDAWRPYADAGRVLDELAARGFRLGVVSNYDSRLRRVLRDLDLERYFSCLIISSECGRAKPSRGIFRTALRELALPPAEVLHVGDRLEEDWRAPRRAGLKALWLCRGGSRRAGYIIGSLDRVPARLPARAAS